MLEEVLPKHQDNVYYFLGDYINKGPDSKGTIDYLMDFAHKHTCRFIRGNHEQMLLDHLEGLQISAPQMALLQEAFKNFGIDSVHKLPYIYLKFLSSMEWYIKLPNFLLVHAGFDFDSPDIFLDKKSMLDTKSMKYDAVKACHRKVVRGHIPHTVSKLLDELISNSPVIGLDTGCVYSQNKDLAVLTAMDLDTLQLYHQPNIEPAYFIERR